MRLSNRRYCVCSMIRKFSRRSSPYCAVGLEHIQSNEHLQPGPHLNGEKTVVPEITDKNPHEVDPHLTAKIVESYVRHHTVGTGQISELIRSVHGALAQLGRPNQPEEVLTPAVSVSRSVNRDYVICLDCGYRGKTLRRHIFTRHGLGPDEYRQRWGLRSNHPLTAPAYSEHRSIMAKARSLGRKLVAPVASAKTPKASPAAIDVRGNPKARRSSRPPALKSTLAGEAAAPMPAMRRRSRTRVASTGG